MSVSFAAHADQPVAPAPAPAPEATPPAPPAAEPTAVAQDDAPVAPAVTPAPAPAVAAPAPAPKVETAKAPEAAKKDVPWRGSLLYYGLGTTALSLNPGAEPNYDPHLGHHLDFWLEWHWSEKLYTRGTFSLTQSFTLDDDTNRPYEVAASDLNLDTGIAGIDLGAGIKTGGAVRLSLPTSKASMAQTRLFGLGLLGSLSRKFNLGGGVNVIYMGGFNWRFHRSTTAETQSRELPVCDTANSGLCAELNNTGLINAWGALSHGPRVLWTVNEKLMVIGYFQLANAFLYRLTPSPEELAGSTQLTDENAAGVRYSNSFGLILWYQLTEPVGLSAGLATAGPQLAPDSTYRNPFFNRLTSFSLDAVIDLEVITNRLARK